MKTSWFVAVVLCCAALAFAGTKHKQTLTLRWQPLPAEQTAGNYAVPEVELLNAEKKLRSSLAKLGLDVQLGYLSNGEAEHTGSRRVGKLWIGRQTLEECLVEMQETVPAGQEITSEIIVKAGLAAASKLISVKGEAR